jgi:hypothetical protein
MRPESYEYYRSEGLDKIFEAVDTVGYGPNEAIDINNITPFLPDLDDLVRLHQIIRQRKVLTVMEFGVGYSTVVMADALAKNKADYEHMLKDIRCLHPFKIFSVDADEHWIEEAWRKFPDYLKSFASISYSEVYMGAFNDRFCHYYKNLPNVTPDFIYLDGPSGHQVKGMVDGSDFRDNMERTVIAGDLLRLEPTFTPGAFIVVDGRANNARFLKNNFQRNWKVNEDQIAELTTFELTEPPLGVYNLKRLQFQGLI